PTRGRDCGSPGEAACRHSTAARLPPEVGPLARDPPRSAGRQAMTTRKLDPSDWRAYCDSLSKALLGKQAQIEVASLTLGSQSEVEGLPLLGIVYDERADSFEIALAGLDHIVPPPREFYVDEGPDGVSTLAVTDDSGTRQIIRLREPLTLP